MDQSQNEQDLAQQLQALLEESWSVEPEEPFLAAPEPEEPAASPEQPLEEAFARLRQRQRQRKRKRRVSWRKELMLMLRQGILMLAVMAILLTFFFRIARVEGESMLPTLIDRDWLLLRSSTFYTPQKGDIVVFMAPEFGEEPLIKRVIATEGDTVDIDFEQGIVYVNDVALDEPYILSQTHREFGEKGVEFPQQVQPGRVFVLGDNRNNSSDSRHRAIGQVDCEAIFGKALLVLWPGNTEQRFQHMGLIGS